MKQTIMYFGVFSFIMQQQFQDMEVDILLMQNIQKHTGLYRTLIFQTETGKKLPEVALWTLSGLPIYC